jgi:sterol 3beta-glucosyltransferase
MTTSEVREAERRSSEQGYFDQDQSEERRSSVDTVESTGGVPADGPARKLMQERISKEENLAGEEEAKEMDRVSDLPTTQSTGLAPASSAEKQRPSDDNAPAALREGSGEDEVIEDQMMVNPSEKKRLRREQLAERLQEVFGLEEREDVLDEMRCWLLRSVSKYHHDSFEGGSEIAC